MNKFCLVNYTHNEPFFFPIWYNYYSKIFDSKDIYIIDHNPETNLVSDLAKDSNIEIFNTEYNQDFYSLFDMLKRKVCYLLRQYDGIFITESDEILYHKDGLLNAAYNYKKSGLTTVRAIAYEPIHNYFGGEPALLSDSPILLQRKFWREYSWMRKIFFITQPIDAWWNMHNFDDKYSIADYALTHIHLKYIDYQELKKRNDATIERKNISPTAMKNNFGWQNRIKSQQVFDDMFKNALSQSAPIPKKFKHII